MNLTSASQLGGYLPLVLGEELFTDNLYDYSTIEQVIMPALTHTNTDQSILNMGNQRRNMQAIQNVSHPTNYSLTGWFRQRLSLEQWWSRSTATLLDWGSQPTMRWWRVIEIHYQDRFCQSIGLMSSLILMRKSNLTKLIRPSPAFSIVPLEAI